MRGSKGGMDPDPDQPKTENPDDDAFKPKEFFTSERYLQPLLTMIERPRKVVQWRMQQRMKTVSVLLTLCLNIGVDPPDVVKSSPCAKLECWLDPHAFPPQKAIDQIGKALQIQYERWQPRARYKLCLDPDDEAVKKLCISLRRNAKDERLLFHYNGHGVPRPTNNGEIWVFNKNYTQYIPLSLYELQAWVGVPSIYVFDCSAAELIVHWFNKFAEQREQEEQKPTRHSSLPFQTSEDDTENDTNSLPLALEKSKEYILLAACGANEVLPTSPDLPADVFTACLTTPITIALKWFCTQTIITGVSPDLIDKIPGRASDRRTPMGELNWIFTAITDTIAWSVLPTKLFQKLFREDLLVASLLRNFLLAERVMRSCKCTPQSFPPLATTYNHPMWAAWDLEADHCLVQLSDVVNDPNYEYKHSSFFTEQLTAFEVWLEFGTEYKKPPLQLPIVLQVLLSQQHRQRALELLAQFLDLGPWAVNYALSVGIFPYVLKLLQSPANELRQVLVFIWAKILVLDKSCQFDLVKDNGQHYFINVLANNAVPAPQRQQAAFILSVISNNCRPGQSACLNAKLLKISLSLLNHPDALLRRWVVLCLAKVWENNEAGKKEAIAENAHVQLCGLLTDSVPEVRAAVVYALGTFITKTPSLVLSPGPELRSSLPPQPANTIGKEQRTIVELNLGLTFAVVASDASPLVRKELAITLGALFTAYEDKFKQMECKLLRQEYQKRIAEGTLSFLIRSPKAPNSNFPRDFLQVADGKRISGDSSKKATANLKPQTLRSTVPPAVNRATMPSQTPTRGSLLGSSFTSSLNESSSLSTSSRASTEQSREGTMQSDKDEELEAEDDEIYQYLWRGATPLVNDPHPMVARIIQRFVYKIKNDARSELQAAGIRLPPETRKSSPPKAKPTGSRLGFLGKAPPLVITQPFVAPSVLEPEIRSNFYEWSAQYFSQQLFRPVEEDQSSPKFAEKKWKLSRNNDLIRQSIILRDEGKPQIQSMDNEIAILENNSQLVSQLCFHPFEDTIVVSDEHDGISLWNWKEGKQELHFMNYNPTGTRVTCLNLLNEHDTPLIAAGSDDGVMKLWSFSRDDADNKVKLLTAWRLLDDLIPVRGLSGLVLEWQKRRELLIASGNVDIIKVWDLNKELAVQDIATEAQSCVTALTSDTIAGSGHMLVAGCADHSLRVFDKRIGKSALVSCIGDQKGWIVNAFMPRLLNNQVVCGSSGGDVKIWDLRQVKQPTKTIIAHNSPTVLSFAVHDYAPLFAVGTQDQRVRVMTFNGDEVSLIRYHDGFLGQRVGPTSALSFHPYKLMLAAGATDSIVSIYTGETSRTNPSK